MANRQDEAIKFLRKNPGKSTDFCLDIQKHYKEGDATTVILQIADALERALKE